MTVLELKKINTAKDLIVRAMAIYLNHFFIILPYLALFGLPVEICENAYRGREGLHEKWVMLDFFVFGFLLSIICLPAVFYKIKRILSRENVPSFIESLKWGSDFWLSLSWWNFIYVLLAVFWTGVIIIPGFFVFIRYSLLSPVVIFEGKDKNPLGRSKTIVQGHFGSLLGATFFCFFCLWPFLLAGSFTLSTDFIGTDTGFS